MTSQSIVNKHPDASKRSTTRAAADEITSGGKSDKSKSLLPISSCFID